MDVALLAEGVDRNFFARISYLKNGTVALLAEGVDRNTNVEINNRLVKEGRPPRGGRG